MALRASLRFSAPSPLIPCIRIRSSPATAHLSLRRRIMASNAAGSSPKVEKSEQEWRAILSPEQFRILRQKGTEWAGTGKYNKVYDEGIYECAGCGTPLYKSTTKFDSGCGWPAFYEGLPGAINETTNKGFRKNSADLSHKNTVQVQVYNFFNTTGEGAHSIMRGIT